MKAGASATEGRIDREDEANDAVERSRVADRIILLFVLIDCVGEEQANA
jgi:hypothetical protein